MRLAFAVSALLLAISSSALAQTPTAPPPSAPPVQTAPIAAETVVVHIDSPEPVELEVQVRGKWTVVCASPCDKALAANESYRINGDGVRSSKPFRVQPGTTAKLEVEPHSSTGHAVAVVLTVSGGIGIVPAIGVSAILVGGLLFGLILVCPLVDAFSHTSYGGCLGDIAVGVGRYYGKPYVWIPGAVGVALVAGGGVWLGATPRTDVQVHQGAPPPPGRPAGGEKILKRMPEWRGARGELPEIAPPIVVPILRGSF